MTGLRPEPGLQRVSTRPSARGRLSRLACARAKEAGIDVAPLMRKAGVTSEQVEDENAWIPVQGEIKLLELIADALPDDFLGFHLARDYELRTSGLLYYALVSSNELDDALQRGARYSTIANEGLSLTYRECDDVGLTFTYVGVPRHSDRHQIEFWVTALARVCREMTGRQVSPCRIQLTHRRHEDCSEFNAFLGCSVEFGAAMDEIAFPLAIKDSPVVGADPYLNGLLVGYCDEALARRATRSGAVRSAVENAIVPLLPHGKASLGAIARKVGMSQRTLARRLAEEGLPFGKVLDQLRCDLAQRHVRDSTLSISQIAWLLGYQEVSAFTHAFKRWTGKTPRQARTFESAGMAALAS